MYTTRVGASDDFIDIWQLSCMWVSNLALEKLDQRNTRIDHTEFKVRHDPQDAIQIHTCVGGNVDQESLVSRARAPASLNRGHQFEREVQQQ